MDWDIAWTFPLIERVGWQWLGLRAVASQASALLRPHCGQDWWPSHRFHALALRHNRPSTCALGPTLSRPIFLESTTGVVLYNSLLLFLSQGLEAPGSQRNGCSFISLGDLTWGAGGPKGLSHSTGPTYASHVSNGAAGPI